MKKNYPVRSSDNSGFISGRRLSAGALGPFYILTMLVFALSLAFNAQSQTYQLTDLGTVVGTNSFAQGINNQGQVVGYWTSTNGTHAFLYQNGSVADLGVLGQTATNNYALSINNAGQVVGFSESAEGSKAFLYQNGVLTNLESLSGLGSYAFGINKSGQIVGYVDTANGARAFLYDSGTTINIGTLGGTNSYASGINSSLQVAGTSLLDDNTTSHAFLWQDGVINDLNQILGNNIGGWELVDAHGINDSGNIAGRGYFNSQEHGFLFYSQGAVTDLGLLAGGSNSYALGLNNSNQVVGAASAGTGNHAVIWSSGVICDLNSTIHIPGWELKEAYGINDLGQIVGWGLLNGQGRAFMLTPASPVIKKAMLTTGGSSVASQAATGSNNTNLAITVRHAPCLNGGTINGSLKQLNGENATANGGFAMTGDWLVPGTPTLVLNGNPTYAGTVAGNGSNTPSGYQIILNGNCSLNYLRTRVNPISLPLVSTPPTPTGTRTVTINGAGQSIGDATTLRDLTLNGNVGPVSVPPGTYGNFSVNGNSGLVLGVSGGTKAATYNLQNLTLNGNSTLQVVGPIILTVANGFTANGTVGVSNNPTWLQLQVACGGLTLNGGSLLCGQVLAPNGTVIVNGNSTLIGTSSSDQFTLNGGGLVCWGGSTNQPVLNPPTISAQPTNLVVIQGSNAVFSVTLNTNSTTPVSYQWYFNTNTVLANATNGTLVLTNVTLSQAGSYSVAITNSAGGVRSTNATLTVLVPPSIAVQPTNVLAIAGSNVSFTVTASGTTPLNYQWWFGTNLLAGATNSILALTNVSASQSGKYSVVVTNVAGRATSSNAVLTVNVPPQITNQPASLTILQGTNANFFVGATGTAPLNYQWWYGTNLLAGATNSSLILTNVSASQAGNYSVIVANMAGSVTSSNAVLTVNVPPQITVQPRNSTVLQGTNAVFSVVATGTAPLIYRWFYNGSLLAGATNAVVILPNIQPAQAGSYAVVISNVAGSVTSSNAVLTVNAKPVITSQPINQTVIQGSNAVFAITASGIPAPSYQWWFNGATLLAGQSQPSLLLTNVTPSQAGNYSVTVTNAAGNATSSNGVLTVLQPPTISVQPAGVAIVRGSNTAFTVSTAGTLPLSYQWYLNGNVLSNATNSSLNLTNAQPIQAGNYSVTVTNVAGSVTSSSAALSLLIFPSQTPPPITPVFPPVIISQPTNLTVIQGSSSGFSVKATGTAPLSYQWFLNSHALTNATNSTLVFPNTQTSQAGTYTVLVSNQVGSALSGFASLTVFVPPAITVQPANVGLIQGGNAQFSVAATGTSPLSYQWFANTNSLPNATNVTLLIGNAQLSDSNDYSVLVSNVAGTVMSASAALSVMVPPVITLQPTNTTVYVGDSASLYVAASGSDPLTFQWYGASSGLLPGATNSTLSLTNLQTSQSDNYYAVAANPVGTATSSNAALTVFCNSSNSGSNNAGGIPVIYNFSPQMATNNAVITIVGTNFSPNPLLNTVYFGSVQASVLTASLTNLTVLSPAGAIYAPITVTVNGLTAYANQMFLPTFVGDGQIDSSSFQNQFNLQTGSGPCRVLIADLDGDGKPDLIVGDAYSGDISIFQNISTSGLLSANSFAPRVVFSTGNGSWPQPYNLAVADVDGDGKLDIIALSGNGNSNSISIFRNISTPGLIATNSFASRVEILAGRAVAGIAVADFNGDDKPDIVTANYSDNTISIFQNQSTIGVVSFAPKLDLACPSGPYTVTIGDFNQDGKPDIAVGNSSSSTISVFQNISSTYNIDSNSFSSPINLSAPGPVITIVTADVNGDGKLDLVCGSWESNLMFVYQNLSDGGNLTTNSFGAPVNYLSGTRTHTLAIGELDGDIIPDLVLVGELPSIFSIYQNFGSAGVFTNASLGSPVIFPSGSDSIGVSVGDLDGDGRPDIVFCNTYSGTVSVIQNLTPLTAPPVITSQPASLTVLPGSNVVFSITATGTAPLSYQWWFNGTNLLAGANAPTLALANVQLNQAGNYTVVVSNLDSSVTSSNALLAYYQAPLIVTQPANTSVIQGSNAVFGVSSSGTAPLNFQWYSVNGGILAEATNAVLVLTNVQAANADSYYVTVSNPAGAVTSSNAILTYLPQPSAAVLNPIPGSIFNSPTGILLQASAAAAPGDNLTVEFFAANATGTYDLGLASFNPASGYFELNWTQVPFGQYSIIAAATDNTLGLTAYSTPAPITAQLRPALSPVMQVLLQGNVMGNGSSILYTPTPVGSVNSATLSVSNAGNSVLIVSNIAVITTSGANQDFQLANAFAQPIYLQPGTATNVVVSFAPLAADAGQDVAGTLTVSGNDSAVNSLSIALQAHANPAGAVPPTVALTYPLPNTQFISSQTVSTPIGVAATVSAPAQTGSSEDVFFYVTDANGNTFLIGKVSTLTATNGLTYPWAKVPPGNYLLTAVARDYSSYPYLDGISASVPVTVLLRDGNSPVMQVFSGTNSVGNGSTLTFSPVPTNVVNSVTLTITNQGPGILTNTASTLQGGSVFQITPASSFVLPPQTSTNVTLTFNSSGAGVFAGELDFNANDQAQIYNNLPGAFAIKLTGSATNMNQPPVVTLNSPANAAQYAYPSAIALSATAASAPNIALASINFFTTSPTGSVQIGQVLAASGQTNLTGTTTWSPSAPGAYLIYATTLDQSGASGQSANAIVQLLDPTIVTTNVTWTTNVVAYTNYVGTTNVVLTTNVTTVTSGGTNGVGSTNIVAIAPPVANNDFIMIEGVASNPATYPINVLANDVSPGGYPLTLTGFSYYGHLGQVIQSGNRLLFTPNTLIQGTNTIYYNISDGNGGTASASVHVVVKMSPLPTIQFVSPADGQFVDLPTVVSNRNLPLVVYAQGGFNSFFSNAIAKVTFYDQDQPIGTVTAGTNNVFTFVWQTPSAGAHSLAAICTDNIGQQNITPYINIQVSGDPNNTPPVAAITNLSVTTQKLGQSFSYIYPQITNGIFNVLGNAYDVDAGDVVSYQLLLQKPDGTLVANITPGADPVSGYRSGTDQAGVLASNVDLSIYQNGVYDVVLNVFDGWVVSSDSARILLNTQLKIGQFSFSVQDVALPVSGIPLTVTRTYNSFNLNNGEFGYSWTYAMNDINLQLDEVRQDTPDIDGNTFNLRVGGGRDVTLTLPDGRTENFQFYFDQSHPGAGGFCYAAWKSAPGVSYTLTAIGNPYYASLTGFWNNQAGTGFDSYDFSGYILTAHDGTQYIIQRDDMGEYFFASGDNGGYSDNDAYVHTYGDSHLVKIIQPNGDVIQINSDKIDHYNPAGSLTRSVRFERDGQGRITAVRDPNSGSNGLPVMRYVYDSIGNLVNALRLTSTNGNGSYDTVTYEYTNSHFPHFMTGIVDPRGVGVAKNFFDDSGRLIGVQDANGNLTQFVHNTTNSMDIIFDRLGHTNTYVYDLRGNVTAQTNAAGEVKTMAYDTNNNKTNEISYFNGQPYATNSYQFDNNNLLLASSDPLGNINSFVYDNFGRLLVSTDARGSSTTNTYDSGGNLLSSTDALGNSTYNSYNNGLLTSSTDAIGNVTSSYYDDAENQVASATVDASGNLLSTNSATFDNNGNRQTSTVWRQVAGVWTPATTTYYYDELNRVVQTVDPDGGTNTVVYNSLGKQASTIDKLGRTTSYTYDGPGRLVQTTYPDLTTESSVYDAAGNRSSSVDRAGRVTTYTYDALNRLVQTLYPDQTTSATVYDNQGRVAQSVDARGTITGFTYDAAGRRLAVTNAVGTTAQTVSTYTYDANGNQITFTDANQHTTTSVFDTLNRQVQTLYADGTQTGNGYDAAGRRVLALNQDQITTLFGYDGAGRLTSVTNALGTSSQTVTRYQYDEAGNQVAQIDALNHVNTYTYDSLGRRIAHALPGAQSEGFAYDLGGNLLYTTNYNGVIITNQYDVMNRLTNQSSVNGYKVGYSYNSATGQRVTMTDASGTTTYSYDNRDRLLLKTLNRTGGQTASLNYRYDANGSVTNIWSGSTNGVNLVYAYDPLSRLTNVLANGNAVAAYNYDSVGNLQGLRYGNGVNSQYQYDTLNRLTNLTASTVSGTIASFYYQLGLTGNRTSLNETVNGTTRTYGWQYDSLYRMTNETMNPLGAVAYAYDAVGNRTNRQSTITQLSSAASSYNANDWLGSDKYDNNGSTTNSGGNVYQYDVLNRLTNVNNTIFITYDGDGNRVSKTIGNQTTWYLVDDRNPSGYAQVLEESQGATLSRVYNYGLALISQRQVTAGVVSYYGIDGHGSTRFLTSSTGGVTDTYTYDAYGNLVSSSGTTPNNYLYCGQQWDTDLGLYYNRARYYKPDSGRFWTMDTYEGSNEDPLSLHKYLYCQGNPVNGWDPSGHDDIITMTASIGNQMTMAMNYVGRPIMLYNRVKTMLDTLQGIRDIFGMIVDGGVGSSIRDALRNTKGVWKDISVDAVMADLENNLFTRVAPAVLETWPMALASSGQMPKAIGISMPLPVPMPKLPPLKIGTIPNTDLDLDLIFGASGSKWGRVVGMELQLPRGWSEVWRMDYHKPHEDPQDFMYWKSSPFHYHVKNFVK